MLVKTCVFSFLIKPGKNLCCGLQRKTIEWDALYCSHNSRTFKIMLVAPSCKEKLPLVFPTRLFLIWALYLVVFLFIITWENVKKTLSCFVCLRMFTRTVKEHSLFGMKYSLRIGNHCGLVGIDHPQATGMLGLLWLDQYQTFFHMVQTTSSFTRMINLKVSIQNLGHIGFNRLAAAELSGGLLQCESQYCSY